MIPGAVLAVVAGLLAAWPAHGRADPGVLRGLAGPLAVRTDEIPAELGRAGLGPEALAEAAAAGLREAGIPEAPGAGAGLRVGVRASHMRAAGLYAYAAWLRLEEPVRADRLGPEPVLAATWQETAVGTVLRGDVARAVLDAVQDLSRRFANEYRAENPAADRQRP